ncbi:MAG: hypothetical protein AB8G99_18100 [Planctomycetaceae bacterium]
MTTPDDKKIKIPIVELASGFPMYVMLCAICLLASGIAHGLWTARWTKTGEVPHTLALARIPQAIGEWVGKDLAPLDHPQSVQSLHRQYTNRITDRSISVLLVAGDPAIVLDQPITRLYSGHAYRAVNDPVPLNVRVMDETLGERVLHAFLTSDLYAPASLKTEQLITVWGWTRSGIWESPAQPLDQYAEEPFAYRLYVTQAWDFAAQSRPNDIEDFLTVATPVFSGAIGNQPDEEKQP